MTSLTKKAVMEAVLDFTQPLSDTQVCELQGYLIYGFLEKAPNGIQKNFTDEFFGAVEWAEFIQEMKMEKRPPFTNVKPTEYLLQDIRVYMSYAAHKRMEKVLDVEREDSLLGIVIKRLLRYKNKVAAINKVKRSVIKDLKTAVNNSYEDGEFSKIEGWCNVMDVLMKYNLLKEKDFKD